MEGKKIVENKNEKSVKDTKNKAITNKTKNNQIVKEVPNRKKQQKEIKAKEKSNLASDKTKIKNETKTVITLEEDKKSPNKSDKLAESVKIGTKAKKSNDKEKTERKNKNAKKENENSIKESEIKTKKIKEEVSKKSNITKKTKQEDQESKRQENVKTKLNKAPEKGKIKVSQKVQQVKKKFSEEVAKATSEKSSKIQLNKKEKNIDDTIEKENKVEEDATNLKQEQKSQIMNIEENLKDNNQKSEEEYEETINTNYIEEKFDIEEIGKELKRRKTIPNLHLKEIIKKSYFDLIYAIAFILFLIFTNYGFYHIFDTALIKDINIFVFVFLGISLIFFETSYKKENFAKCINGIETIFMASLALTLPYVYQIHNNIFINTIKILGILISIYYLIKTTILFFRNKNQYIRAQDNFTRDEEDHNELEDEEVEE